MKKLLKKFRSVQTRHGFYSVGMIAVVIVIAVVVNLIVASFRRNGNRWMSAIRIFTECPRRRENF